MKIIISPAKKMNSEPDLLSYKELPQFLAETKELLDFMRQRSYEESKKIWKCNDQIAAQNYERFATMDLACNLTPAVLSYEGIQYQYMAPTVLSEDALNYIEEHLRILSGFYGVLRPFDGIVPYRLEMQAKLNGESLDSLYTYWGDKLAKSLLAETDCIINLASKEYSKCISKYVDANTRFLTCVFGELKDGKVKEKSTQVKMARGEMVRFLAEEGITDVERIKEFNRADFVFSEELSDDTTFVFVKGMKEQC